MDFLVVNRRLAATLAALCVLSRLAVADTNSTLSVMAFGASAAGANDNTQAFQNALNAASGNGGGIVYAPPGNYYFAGHLIVPPGVTLEGSWEYVPSHPRANFKKTPTGTTLFVTENAGAEEGPAFITLAGNSTVKGVTIYYPNQITTNEPIAYPYAIAMRGDNPAVLEVELLNPYNGIDAADNQRALIRDVHGQPLRRGIYVNRIMDVGRIENVHFNPWWSIGTPVYKWQTEHGEAFIFGRTDWHYVLNTFCFGYNVGYKFIHTPEGECNGNFVGIGADDCFTDVVVEASAPFGILISNGEFVSFHGPDPTMVRVTGAHRGTVRFSNCAFWGPCNQIARIDGSGTVGFSDCTFCQWNSKNDGGSAIQAVGGTLLVRGCEFQQAGPQVELGQGVKRAVITDNVFGGAEEIANHSTNKVAIANNVGK